ncbi:adenosylcobinamide-phosphate synthase CbiB [Shewanella sp. TC10]|uniref:adenosylcobinamide-phosphate synthase CbiB n=1 Tax=Shewanella sp. TC10 TaxID=1419739 RepID=UPI00129E81F8|nr:adenosylcobinamide-phosphate synthase CbiB [Shewanella sp. TC10]
MFITDISLWHCAAVTLLALLIDRICGEPTRYHPLVTFGRWARFIELLTWRNHKISGLLAWILVCAPLLALVPILNAVTSLILSTLPQTLSSLLASPWWIDAIILYLIIGGRSLQQHAEAISNAYLESGLDGARNKVAMIVSRDTSQMNEQQVVNATLESVLENANDAVFGALFWYVVGGLPAALLYRGCNTLDAMWGYKNTRFFHFGYVAAKIDDLMNYIPARLLACVFALLGQTKNAFNSWATLASKCVSPNGGVVMNSGAGALGIEIGGKATYFGKEVDKAPIGIGRQAEMSDIPRATQLANKSYFAWPLTLCLLALVQLLLT